MAICNHLAPNDEKSELYQALAQEYGDDKAHDYWTAIRTQQFLNKTPWLDQRPVNIYYGANDNKELSNLADRPFTYKGDKFRSVEHAYQTYKSGSYDDKAYNSTQRKPLSDRQRADNVSEIMEDIIRESYKQNPQALQKLLDTGSRPLTHNQDKGFWNKEFPRIMMKIRGEFSKDIDPNGEPTVAWVKDKLGLSQPSSGFKPAKQLPIDKAIEEPTPSAQQTSATTESTHNFDPKEKEQLPTRAELVQKVHTFYDEAENNPNHIYHIDYEYSNKNERTATGFTAKELAVILDSKSVPSNVRFTESFYRLLKNTSRRIIAELGTDAKPEFITRDATTVAENLAQNYIPKVNSAGEAIGYYDSAEQKEITNSIITATGRLLSQDPGLGANALIKAINSFYHAGRKMQAEGTNMDRAAHLNSIYNSRVRLADLAIQDMANYGLTIDPANRAKILEAVGLLRLMDEAFRKELLESGITLGPSLLDKTDTGEFIEATGRGLKDWNDVSFELDPKDTAGSRIKMFIATLPEMDRGVYRLGSEEAHDVHMDTEAITVGTKSLADLIKAKGVDAAMDEWKDTNPKSLQDFVQEHNRKALWAGDDKTSAEIATYLSKNYPMVAKTNFIGMNKNVDFESTFQGVLSTTAGLPRGTFESYVSALDNTGQPNLQYLSRLLRGKDKQFQNEFFKVISKQYKQSQMLLHNTVTDFKTKADKTTANVIGANRYGEKQVLIDRWKEQQKLSSITIIGKDGKRSLDVERINKNWIPFLKEAAEIKDWSNQEDFNRTKKSVGNILRASGIDFTDDMVDYLFKNMAKLTKGTRFAASDDPISRQFKVNAVDGKPNGMFSAFIMKAAGMVLESDDDKGAFNEEDVLEAQKLSQQNNPLYTEGTTMGILAKVGARFTPSLQSASHKTSEGKTEWDFVQHTKLSHKFIQFTADFDDFKELRKNVDVAKNNWLLSAITNQPVHLTQMKLTYFDGTKPMWGKTGTVRSDMSDREQLFTSVDSFQNGGQGFGRVPKVHYLSLTHSDKTMTPMFSNMPRVNIGKEVTNDNIIGKIGSAMYNVFKSEHNRIINQKNIDFNNGAYNKGKGLFYFIPDFNFDHMTELVEKGVISQQEMNLLYTGGQRGKFTEIINDNKELPVINKILTNFLGKAVKGTLDKWKSAGLVEEETNRFDHRYVRNVVAELGLKGFKNKDDIFSYKDKNGTVLDKAQTNKAIAEYAARDYTINHFLMDTALSQLFYGDPAQTYKEPKGNKNDITIVNTTMKEYAKRLAKDIAPGQDPYWEQNDKKYNTITIKDVKPSEKYMETYPELAKAYRGVEGTDAQEYTTVAEHLKVAYAMGTIPTKTYNEMMAIIKDAKGGYYEFTLPEHKAIVMQPVKPVYSGDRVPQNGALLEDYVKSSSYPLYPPLTSGTEMEHLRVLMEKNGIDRANFASAKKIGNPTAPIDLFNTDGTFKQNYDPKQLKLSQQVLNRDGFRIQQEVPYDEEKEAIKTVSQMNKLITESIAHIDGFEIPGHGTMNGREVRLLKEDVRKRMITKNLNDLADRMDFKRDPSTGKWTIQDKNALLDTLSEEARKKGYSPNELQGLTIRDDNGDLQIPVIFNGAADRLESVLMSLFNKVPDVKMPGKSFVQGSAVGYTFKKEGSTDTSKVVWVDGYDGSALKTLRNEDGTIKAAQVIMPFNFTKADGSKAKVEDYMVEKDGKRYLDTTKVPKELIQMIGARIPNQGHNSMLPIEVVGFLPAEMGDLIIVPSAITKQMGADFDVDKLYTYKRAYTHDAETNTFKQVEKETPEDKDSKGTLQNDYFNIHWGVLMHPEMMEKVLKPLDKDDLKDEAAIFEPKDSDGTLSYYHPISQLEDFQRGKDAKAMVGLTSLSNTFNAVIQDKNLHLYEMVPSTGQDGKMEMVPQRKYLTVRDEHTGKPLKLTNLSGYGTSTYTKIDGSEPTKDDIRTKGDNHTTTQNASVDNAKDRSLDNLNLNTNTNNAASAFIQLETEDGKAVNLKYITRLMTQPVIREFDSRMKSGNDSLSDGYTPNLKDKTLADLEEKLMEQATNPALVEARLKAKDDDAIIFDPQLLKKAQTMTGDDYIVHQIAALRLFKELDTIGTRKAEIQSLANGDVNGAGSNILNSLDRQEKMTRIVQEPIANADQVFMHEGRITEQGHIFNITTKIVNDVLTKILPYDKFKPMFDTLAKITGKVNLTADQQKNVLRSVRSFVYTHDNHWWPSVNGERIRLFYNQEGEPSLAQRVMQAKGDWGKDNFFLSRLNPKIGDGTTEPDFIEYQAATAARIDEQQNTRAWLDMLMSDDEAKRSLGEDLLRYAYLTGGIQDANSFVKFVPTSYIANTEFGNMLKHTNEKLVREEQLNVPGFLEQHIQHNPDLAQRIDRGVFMKPAGAQWEYPESFKVPSVDSPLFNSSHYQLFSSDKELLPFVSYRSKVDGTYKLYALNHQGEGVYYVRVDTLGNKYTDEYNGDQTSMQRSIFQDNRALLDKLPAVSGIQEIANAKKTQYGDYNKNVTHYDEINLHAGGQLAIDRGIDNIIDNKDVPAHLRTVAELLKSTAPITQSAIDAIEGLKVVPSISFGALKDARGSHVITGNIILDPSKTKDIEDASEVFLHEVMHGRLVPLVLAGGYDSRDVELSDKDRSNMAEWQKKNPEIMNHLKELDRLRYEAYTHYMNSGNTDKNILYGLSNMQEFLAHVMTHKGVQEYLNNIQSSKGTSLLADVWARIARIFSKLAESMGFKVKDGSILEQALQHTIALTGKDIPEDRDFTTALTNHSILHVKTESEADELTNLSQDVYGYHADKFNNFTDYSVKVTNKKHAVQGQVGRVLDELYKQMEDAGYALNNAKGNAARVALRIRYRDLKDDINELSREKNVALIGTIGNKQLQWVDKVLSTPSPSATDVLAAIDTTNIWGGLTDILYSGYKNIVDTNPIFDKLQSDAQKRRIALINTKSLPVVNDMLNGRIILTGKDMADGLQDFNFATANFQNLSRVKPLLVQSIAVTSMQRANNEDEEYSRVVKRLNNIDARMKAAGLKDDYFIQEKSWGLVHRLSGEWYDYQKKHRNKLEATLDSLDRSDKMDEKARNTRKATAWANYWNEMKKTTAYVDTRSFFDFTSGDKLSGDKADKAFKDLAKKVGSDAYAQELVDKAHKRFKEYIDEKEIAKEHITAGIKLSEEEQKLSVDEQEALVKRRSEEEFEKWLHYNSPNEFMNKMGGEGDLKYVNGGDRWIVSAPLASRGEFYDKRYDVIQKNDTHRKIYDDYRGLIQEMVSYLPATEQAKLSEDFLPIVSKETVTSIGTMLGKIRNWDSTILNAFTATEAQEAARHTPDRIPISYTRETAGTKERESKSNDIVRIADIFSRMALHYKHMSPILDNIKVAEAIINDVNRQRVTGKADGTPLRNTLDAIQYFKDALIYQKPQELQGKIDNALYSANLAKNYRIQNEIKELVTKKKELDEAIMARFGEGESDTKDLDKQIEVIDKKLDEYAKNARHIYGSKAVNTLISINQVKSIAYNPVSAISNFAFGMISVSIHANSRIDFGQKELAWAMGKLKGSVQKYFTLGAVESDDARKVLALMERTGVMTELGSGDRATLLEAHKRSHLKNAISPMNWQVSGDFYAKGAMMLAMLKTKTVEVPSETGGTKSISLWDALDNEGKWNDKLYGQNEKWYSDDLDKQTDWNNYRDRMRAVSVLVFGNQDKNAPLMAKKQWLLRLAGQFRMSWFPEGLATRFQESRFNIQLDRQTKGRWVTYKDLGVFTSASIMLKQLLSTLPGTKIDPFSGVQDKKGNEITSVDIENMRKNFAGLAWTAGFTATILILRAMYEDDHKKGHKKDGDAMARQLLINMLVRNQQDLTLYSSPSVINTVAGNLLPATGVLIDTWNALKASGVYMLDHDSDKHAFKKWATKVTRAIPYANLYNKGVYMATRDIDAVSR